MDNDKIIQIIPHAKPILKRRSVETADLEVQGGKYEANNF